MASGKTMKAVISLAGEVDPSLKAAVETAEDMVGGVGDRMRNGVAAGAVAAGAAVAGALYEGVKAGDGLNRSMNQVAAATGTYGADLEELKGIALDVYGENLGGSLDEVTAALGTLKQVTDLEGEALGDAAQSGLMLSDTFGYDISESARTASTMMRNFGIDAEEAYGLMAVGAQQGADQNGDLLDTLNEYSNQYAALGFSADEFTQSLIAGAEAGAFSVDKVGDAVKEFNIRAKDGSDTSAAAFAALGMDAQEMTARFAAGGDAANAAFFEVVDALNSMSDPVQKNAAAVGLFGTQFEDLEANVLPALASIRDASIDGEGALESIGEVRYDSIGDALQGIGRQVEVALLPTFSEIAGAVADAMPRVMDALGQLSPVLEPLLGLVTGLLGPVGQMAMALLPPVVSLLSAIIGPVAQLASALLPPLMTVVSALAPVIGAVVGVATTLLNTVIQPLIGPVTSLVNTLLPPIAGLLASLSGPISSLIGWLGSLLGALQPIVDGFGNLISLVGQAASAVANSPVGQFVSGIGSALGFAKGGFTSGPAIAGEDPRYPREAVISFNPAYRAQNVKYWAMAGHMLGASPRYERNPAPATGAGGAKYDLSGMTFAPRIEVRGNASRDDIVAALRQAEPEFVDFIVEALERREEAEYDHDW